MSTYVQRTLWAMVPWHKFSRTVKEKHGQPEGSVAKFAWLLNCPGQVERG